MSSDDNPKATGHRWLEPLTINLDPEQTYLWCRCGKSADNPFCDGQHDRATRPLPFQVPDPHTVWLCTCQQTKKPPYCDGSHNHFNNRHHPKKAGIWGWLSRLKSQTKTTR